MEENNKDVRHTYPHSRKGVGVGLCLHMQNTQ